MSTDLEKFIAHRDSTKDAFDAWNEKQPETRKIRNRLPFTIVWPTVKYSEGIEKKAYVNAKGESGVNSFKKIKGIDSQGSEVSYKVQLPSVIAPRGFAENKGDNGLVRALLIVFDLENPDHKLTCDNIDKHITTPACHEIMKSPGVFSMPEVKQILDVTEAVLSDPNPMSSYKMNMMLIKAKMSKIVNFPKKDKNTYIEDSPLRTMFLNPLFYADPLKPNEPPNEMGVSLKLTPGVPAIPIKPDVFLKLCEGKKYNDEGKMVGQTRLGCECSPEAIFSKLNIGSKPSTKTTCTNVTVTRLQEAPKSDTQAEKHTYMDQNGVIDEFTNQLNLEELLAGLSTGDHNPAGATVLPGNSFNPMGVDSGLPEGVNTSTGGSLVASLQNQTQTPQQILTQQHQSSQPSLNLNQGAGSPQQSVQQPYQQQAPVNPMTQQFGGSSLSQQSFNNVPAVTPSLSFSAFPPPMPQMGSAPSLNMSGGLGDRLGSFHSNMIPVTQLNGSI